MTKETSISDYLLTYEKLVAEYAKFQDNFIVTLIEEAGIARQNGDTPAQIADRFSEGLYALKLQCLVDVVACNDKLAKNWVNGLP
ncbi:unnamed protein product, partial [Symbiodinium sp. KB8]